MRRAWATQVHCAQFVPLSVLAVLLLWISPDPIRGTGNKYVYAYNDPLSKVDPSGLLVYVEQMNPSMAAWFASEMNRPDPLVWAESGGMQGVQVGAMQVGEAAYLSGVALASESGNEEAEDAPRLQRCQAAANTDAGQHAQQAQNLQVDSSAGAAKSTAQGTG